MNRQSAQQALHNHYRWVDERKRWNRESRSDVITAFFYGVMLTATTVLAWFVATN